MPKPLSKMTAAVDKLKLIHPQSRKAAQMQKKVHREIRAIKQKKGTLKKQHIVGERVSYFKENLKADGNLYTPQEALELIERYLGRFDEEVEQIDLRNSIGQRRTQQHASRLDAIQMTHELEVNEFNGPGIEIPDIMDLECVNYLRQWSGQIKYLQNIKMRRYKRKDFEEDEKKSEMEIID
ncbi:translation machinery-associated protein 16-like isoform X2 [Artemia franciscana]|uniref:translation machinery-associated protein 16-like isoform X2 n=1 Tax=Artemia franciscana TaxID=6661 RepID=UPI0032DBA022